MQIVKRLLNGDKRALARAITIIENEGEEKDEILNSIYPYTGQSYIIGITGPPGAGKSSLTNKLIGYIRNMGFTVGVLAVDPTSPFSGGALLGDRIRMQEHALDPGVFIRSMGTRGSLGGIARATKDAIKVLDAFGKDIIIIETVGVGQCELDVMYAADSTVVVLTPGAGDIIQTLKAGIMEIADIFVINKSDMPGTDKLEIELQSVLNLKSDEERRPPIVKVVAINGVGIDKLYKEVEIHKKYLENSGQLNQLRLLRVKNELFELLWYNVKNRLENFINNDKDMKSIITKMTEKKLSPQEAAKKILNTYYLDKSF